MSELKVKFNVFEKRLVMQVIEQNEKLIGNSKSPIEFMTSNGIIVTSSLRPGIYPKMNKISLRGEDEHEKLAICHARFDSTEDAIEFMNKLNVALGEFINYLRLKVVDKILNNIGDQIDFPDCSLLFSIIRGGFIIQVIKSNIKDAKFINNGKLSISISNDTVDVTLPFNSDESVQELITLKGYTDEQIRTVIKEIIKKVYMNSQSEADKPVAFNNSEYPEFIYEV